MTEIKIHDIVKNYGRGGKTTEVLKDINITISPGEFFFLLGPSGCGKTTLLRIIAGLIKPTAGHIFFNEDDITDLSVEKRNCALVFQNYALWPHMTVSQNVEFGPQMKGIPAKEREEIAQSKLHLVQMADYKQRKPNQLSGGQQQRVALARALAAEPACLLLDEPLSNLDARLRMQMRTELRQLVKDSGMTAIYVTHDQKEALSMADRIAIVSEGQIVQIASPEEIYSSPATPFVADFVGEANFLPGLVKARGEKIVIETPVAMLESTRRTDLPLGTDVLCCVRPERITLEENNLEKEPPGREVNRIPAKVATATYLGEATQFHFSLSDTSEWKMTAMAAPQIAPNQNVYLKVDAQDVIILTR